MTKIKNKCKLPYKVIGSTIDRYLNSSIGDTLYDGKIDYYEFIYQMKAYKVEVKYLKRDVVFTFIEIGDI